MALVMVAKDKGFFEQAGLDVEIKEFAAGKLALQALLGGSLDFSVSGDVPPLLAILQGNSLVVPAQVVGSTVNEVRVVARKDGDLNTAEDYFKSKKRKLATSFGGGPEFFTYEFLNKLGVGKDQIEILSQQPNDMPTAIASGGVDAIAVFDPFAYFAEKELGGESLTFTDKDIYSELYVLEASPAIKQNPVVLNKFLSALLKAEKFVSDNPDESKDIVAKYAKLDRATVDKVWGNADYRVVLNPKLLEFWGREAVWAKSTGKISPEAKVPDFKDFIFDAPLKALVPSAVKI